LDEDDQNTASMSFLRPGALVSVASSDFISQINLNRTSMTKEKRTKLNCNGADGKKSDPPWTKTKDDSCQPD
jgi:hypothetical protein